MAINSLEDRQKIADLDLFGDLWKKRRSRFGIGSSIPIPSTDALYVVHGKLSRYFEVCSLLQVLSSV